MKRLVLVSALVLLPIHIVSAAPVDPRLPMTFQTNLHAGDYYNFTFSIYNGAGPAARRLWYEGPVALRVQPGKTIEHKLGSIRPLGTLVDFSQQLYVQVTGGGQTQRVKLGAVPYAMYSLTPGPQGPKGDRGVQGPPGSDGVACWDLNGNGTCDVSSEDKNGSGDCTVTDCRGPQGEAGLRGEAGLPGSQGSRGDIGPQGPAGLTWKGSWARGATYSKDDAVEFDGSAWVSLASDNAGSQPDSFPEKWGLLARKGPKGDKGDPGDVALAGKTCDPGFYLSGFDAAGNLTCAPLPSLPTVSCPTGQCLTGISETGAPLCSWCTITGSISDRYVYFEDGKTWADAKLYCESIGAHLAILESPSEKDRVLSAIGGEAMLAWLGGFQPPGSQEPGGGWTWISGEPLSWFNWHQGDPDNSYMGQEVDCLTMVGPSLVSYPPGAMGDYVCEFPMGFVCEFEQYP